MLDFNQTYSVLLYRQSQANSLKILKAVSKHSGLLDKFLAIRPRMCNVGPLDKNVSTITESISAKTCHDKRHRNVDALTIHCILHVLCLTC